MSTLSIILQSLLILVFFMAGSSKIAGVKQQVDSFKHLGLPQWFRVVTGLVQYVGIAGLVLGYWYPGMAAWAGIWLGITMLLASLAHIKVKDSFSKALAPLVLAVLAIILIFINADGLQHPFS